MPGRGPRLPEILLLLPLLGAPGAPAQSNTQGDREPASTLRITTNLVLVNVVALRGESSEPLSSLTRDDLALFDNNHPVPIRTFEAGGQARPLAVWFLVQCAMSKWDEKGSGTFRGRTGPFLPVLTPGDRTDAFGVAHWCDDGASALDLFPTSDADRSLLAVEDVLSIPVTPESHERRGELALQAVLGKIVDATRTRLPGRIPAVILLYNDYSAMPKGEADHFVDQLLGSSITVYGLRDQSAPRFRGFGGEKGSIAGYFAGATGGSYLSLPAAQFPEGLARILSQLHARYELGFSPPSLDGERHKLRVALSRAARRKYPGIRLNYRSGYFARAAPGM